MSLSWHGNKIRHRQSDKDTNKEPQGKQHMEDNNSTPRPSTLLAKTRRAWELLPFPQLLGRQAPTLVLLANGRRTLRELSLLIGDDVTPIARRLLDKGLLQMQRTPELVPAD